MSKMHLNSYLICQGDRFLSSLPNVGCEDREKMLKIERLRQETDQDLYVIAGQIYSLSTHPIDSWTLFRWMQEKNIPSRFIIRRESSFFKSIEKQGLDKDVVTVDTDCLHNELLDLEDLWIRAKAFIVEWRTDSVVDVWLQHLSGCRYVFLQHGILGTWINNVLKKVFVEEYNDINVSSEYEMSLIANNDDIRKKCFIAGLPRYDTLEDLSSNAPNAEKIIFVMMTWRSRFNADVETFYNSQYFKGLRTLFSEKNVNTLQQKGIRFVFAPHHMLCDNIGEFKISEGVDFVKSQEEIFYWIRHAHAFVTDLSSVAFDFMFQNKPVIFWIPDKDDPQLNHQDDQDGGKIDSALSSRSNFPNAVNTVDEVIEKLLYYLKRNFVLEDEFKEKSTKYFDNRDHFCERVFNCVNSRISMENANKVTISKTPKISIIIPAYNVERFLFTCLESINAQTYDDYEVILIDDGSTDYTSKICEVYSFKNHRIRAFRQENAGVSAARNKGIELARGEYITFIDADDWVDANYLSVLVQTQPECDLLFFGNVHHYQDGTMHAYSPGDNFATECLEREELLLRMSQNECWFEFLGYTWNKRFKRDIIQQHQLRFMHGLSLREDELFTNQYARKINSLATTHHCIYNYRFSHNGLTYHFHPGKEVLMLAQGLEDATESIQHPRLYSFYKSKVFHYMFTATLNLHTQESLNVFNILYAYYKKHHGILIDDNNPFLDKRVRKRYMRLFAGRRWLSQLRFLLKRKLMKKSYHGV